MKFNCIDAWSFCCYLITDKGLILLNSGHIRFYTIFAPFKIILVHITGNRGKGENLEKTTWHTHKQNVVCVTCDCISDLLGSDLWKRVHCLGVVVT